MFWNNFKYPNSFGSESGFNYFTIANHGWIALAQARQFFIVKRRRIEFKKSLRLFLLTLSGTNPTSNILPVVTPLRDIALYWQTPDDFTSQRETNWTRKCKGFDLNASKKQATFTAMTRLIKLIWKKIQGNIDELLLNAISETRTKNLKYGFLNKHCTNFFI